MADRKSTTLKYSAALGFCALVLAAGNAISSSTANQASQSPTRTPGWTASPTTLIPSITNREEARTLSFYLETTNRGQVVINPAIEIDVTSITFSNGYFTQGVADRGGLEVTTGSGADLFYMASSGFGTESVTFSTPLRLRTGDTILLTPELTAPDTTAEWDITIHGRVPSPSGFLLK